MPPRGRRIALVISCVLIGAAAGACGSSSTGPGNGPLTGTWTLSAPNMTMGSASCAFSGTMSITQTGSSLHGDLPDPGITTVCVTTNSKDSVTDAGTGLAGGNVSGSNVSLSLDNNAVQATGTVSGNMMSGTTMTINYPNASIVNATGSWTATKQ
jgi:hypothetical protein